MVGVRLQYPDRRRVLLGAMGLCGVSPALDEAQVVTATDLAGRITAPVRIGAAGPFTFVVDTGANRTVVCEELARDLALPDAGVATVHGIAGAEPAPLVRLPSLGVDAVTLRDLQVPVLPRSRLGVEGLLGMDALRGRRAMLDFRRRRLRLRSAGTGPFDVSDTRTDRSDDERPRGARVVVPARYRFGQLIIIGAEAEGRAVTAILDSGSQRTVGNLALRRLVLGATQDPREQRFVTAVFSATGQTAQGDVAAMPLLKVGGLSVTRLPTVFADLHVFQQWDLTRRPSVLLGADLMNLFDAVELDYGRREVAFWLPPRSR